MNAYNAGQYPPGIPVPKVPPVEDSWTHGWLAYDDPGYVKGVVLGAAVTYLLTNPKVQRALIKGAVGLWATLLGGFEEVKEQIEDVKSEMSMKNDDSKPTE